MNRDLTSLAARLSQDIAPPIDLWPVIRARLGEQPDEIESLAKRLAQEIDAPAGLWSRIEAKLDESPGGRSRNYQQTRYFGFNMAAGIGFLALVGTLIIVAAQLTELVSPDLSKELLASQQVDDTWWLDPLQDRAGAVVSPAIARALEDTQTTIRRHFLTVRDERRAIERAIQNDLNNPRLWDLWRYAYETELALVNEAGRVMNDFQRGYGI